MYSGAVAQMVERSLSMGEVPGSMPGCSKIFFSFIFYPYLLYFTFGTSVCVKILKVSPMVGVDWYKVAAEKRKKQTTSSF